MNRRSAVALAFLALLTVSQPAWGQGNGNANANSNGSGNGNGNGQNNEGGQGNGNGQGNANGNGNANSNANGNGNANGSDSSGVGQPSQPNGAAGSAPVVAGQAAKDTGEQSASDVLAAVEAGRAVPLSTIMPDVHTRTGGEIINAELQQVGSFLLYAVTVLTPGGMVSTEYYYARSGQYVGR